jgi:hypothetical protein
MTYRKDITLSAELLEQVSTQGLEILPDLIRVILNVAIEVVNTQLCPRAWISVLIRPFQIGS